MHLGPRDHVGQDQFESVKLLDTQNRSRQLRLNHMFNIFHSFGPSYFNQLFTKISNIHSHATRSGCFNFPGMKAGWRKKPEKPEKVCEFGLKASKTGWKYIKKCGNFDFMKAGIPANAVKLTSLNFHIPRIGSYAKYSFFYQATLDWNNPPSHIKSISDKCSFKSAVKKNLDRNARVIHESAHIV